LAHVPTGGSRGARPWVQMRPGQMQASGDSEPNESRALLLGTGVVADAELGIDSPCKLLSRTSPDAASISGEEGAEASPRQVRVHHRAAVLGRRVPAILAAGLLASVGVWMLRPQARLVQDQLEGHRLLQHTLSTLWSNTCPAQDPLVRELRKHPWPNRKKGKAPKVSKVIYINMKWDRARRNFMEHQLRNLSHVWRKNVSLTWERFEGVGAEHVEKDKAFADWREKGFSKSRVPHVAGDWGIAGCAYSHYSAIKKIPADSKELVVIAEDDVEFKPNFPDMWEELWPWVPDEWDVLRVGWFGDHQNCSQVVNSYVDRAAWQQRGEVCMYCGAQAYIVNPKSKEKVLKRFTESRITHADELLGAPTPLMEDPAKVPPLKAYVAWPMLAQTHFDAGGFPAFASDRIHGRSAVVSSSAAPGTTQNWMPTTRPATTTDNPFAVHWPTTTTVKEAEEGHGTTTKATGGAKTAARERAEELVESRAKSDAAEANRQQLEAARFKAEVRAAVKKQVAKVQREAAQKLAEKAKEAEEAHDASGKAAEREHVAEDARKQAERDAKKAEQEAKEAEQDAQEAGQKAKDAKLEAKSLKRAEKEAEVAQLEASKRADQSQALLERVQKDMKAAQEARAEAEGQAAQIKAAFKAAEAARREAEEALTTARAARNKEENARWEAESKATKALSDLVREQDARKQAERERAKAERDRKEAEAHVDQEKQREKGFIMTPKLPPTLAPLPTMPPAPTMPPMPTLAPLPKWEPLATPAPWGASPLTAAGGSLLEQSSVHVK